MGQKTFIAGVPKAEWDTLQNLPMRPLVPTDVPNLEWNESMAKYKLREDGAVLADGMSIELGWLDGRGGVNWLRAS